MNLTRCDRCLVLSTKDQLFGQISANSKSFDLCPHCFKNLLDFLKPIPGNDKETK
jgi:hypothetical protein